MTQQQALQLFEEKKVRTVWDDEQEKWYFSIVDVVAVLTDSDYQTARKYWKVLKGRIAKEGNELETICYQLKMKADDGKMRMTDVSDTEQLFRIIQSIPSPKAEPFKQWMAQGGRVDCFASFAMTDSRFASLRGGTTKQSSQESAYMDCFASLAMTRGGRVDCFTSFAMTDSRFASLRGGTTKQSKE